MLLRRGDIVLANFPVVGGEAAATRPAVIVSNNRANQYLPTATVVPLSSNLSRVYPHECVLPNQRTGLDHDSKAQPPLIRGISTRRVLGVIGYVPDDLMQQLDQLLREHLAL